MISKKCYLLAATSLLLQNCQQNITAPAKTDSGKTAITRVEWSTFGGQMGYVEKLIITKDSIKHTYLTTMKNNETAEHHNKNTAESWEKLVSSVNLADFRKVKNGDSKLPFDGVDEQISIRTDRSADSLINGSEDKDHYAKIEKFTQLLDQTRAEKK